MKKTNQSILSRREFFQLGAGTVAGLSLAGCGARPQAEAQNKDQPWSFVVLNDLHYTDDNCRSWFEKVIARIRSTVPDLALCFLAGDLSQDGRKEQLTGLKDCFEKLGCRILPVIGNHDNHSSTNREKWDAVFPGRLNYIVEHNGWQFFCIDSVGTNGQAPSIPMDTLNWLDVSLAAADRNKPTALVTHMPLGPRMDNRAQAADEVLARFRDFNLRGTFTGHWHCLIREFFYGTYMINGAASGRLAQNHAGPKEKGFTRCQVNGPCLTPQFVPLGFA